MARIAMKKTADVGLNLAANQHSVPVMRLHEAGDSSVNFICRPWLQTAVCRDVYRDLTATVRQRFDSEGISIPFPRRDVHLFQVAEQAAS